MAWAYNMRNPDGTMKILKGNSAKTKIHHQVNASLSSGSAARAARGTGPRRLSSYGAHDQVRSMTKASRPKASGFGFERDAHGFAAKTFKGPPSRNPSMAARQGKKISGWLTKNPGKAKWINSMRSPKGIAIGTTAAYAVGALTRRTRGVDKSVGRPTGLYRY